MSWVAFVLTVRRFHFQYDECRRFREVSLTITCKTNIHQRWFIFKLMFSFYLSFSPQEVGSIIGKKGEIVKRFREEVSTWWKRKAIWFSSHCVAVPLTHTISWLQLFSYQMIYFGFCFHFFLLCFHRRYFHSCIWRNRFGKASFYRNCHER